MKSQLSNGFGRIRSLLTTVIALACLPVLATTFTNDTAIDQTNTNFDGTDIIISNCTVTVDGPHAFASLRVAPGGVLTHTFYPTGGASSILSVTNEMQVLSVSNAASLLNSNVTTQTISVTDTNGTNVYLAGTDFTVNTISNITQLQLTTNSAITEGTTVLVSYQVLLSSVNSGLNLAIAGTVQVDAGGAINANGKGFGGGYGTGVGHSLGNILDGSGGGYGGIGGTSSSNALGGITYGSFNLPINLGSGGGSGYAGTGGSGGGLIQIAASGAVIVNGTISANGANGTNSRSGGGSGGSIQITGFSFSGTGALTASGGAGEPTHGGGGGGGRIALQYNSTSFAGSLAAYGGVGSQIGGAGTVYKKLVGQNGLLVLDNGGQSGTNTSLTVKDSSVDVIVQKNASVLLTSSWSFGNLTVASNGSILVNPLTTLSLAASGSVTVQAGGKLLADGAGSAAGIGSGGGHGYNDGLYRPCGGGGYGGFGAVGSAFVSISGLAYGSQTSPNGFGSGGGSIAPYSTGGSGGGGIQIIASSGIIQIDGVVSANGINGTGTGGGGGSGGTISISGGPLLGLGSITAAGGAGANPAGGGGGGGRILVSSSANLFAGNISAYGGGGGAGFGGAGTVYLQIPGQNYQLILDNGGHLGTNTPVSSAGLTDLIVRGGAVGSAQQSATFVNLNVSSNSWLAPYFNETIGTTLNFTFTGNATIQAGGGIMADASGSSPGQGPGAGRILQLNSIIYGSGAGHGAFGGNSSANLAIGGNTYDNVLSPNIVGSGGGNSSPLSIGGYGGGIVRLFVTGTLDVEGVISANAGNGSGQAGGGGSGGSIYLSVGTLAGAGTIAANGGTGASGLGGGGAGGLIYVPCNNNSFSGAMTAYGGGGANRGGVGTAVVQLTSKPAQLVLDGGGNPGAPTPITSSSMDITLRNGAVGLITTATGLGNVVISSNTSIIVSNSAGNSGTLSCASMTIQPGGILTADFLGYAGGSGNTAGHFYSATTNYPCSGGGNGGIGGNSFSNLSTGGLTAGFQPLAGSGGGTFSPYSIGGSGGGAFFLTVTGALQIEGAISANGANGSGAGGGGGAGGAVKITAGSLAGGGVIRANGGNGAGVVGGGGGGGWVSIVINSALNQFAGTVSAYGGGGANWGGPGPVLIQTSVQSVQQTFDNGGNSGPATPVSNADSSTLILRNGGTASVASTLSISSLLISSNSFLLVSNNQSSSANLNFTTAIIQAGGGIIGDALGLPANQGNGAGHFFSVSPNYPCSGAGHGGIGGASITNTAVGGSAYDSQSSPSQPGSGGGSSSPYSIGGIGGSAVSMSVSGLLQVDGVISFNGGNGSGIGGGGGAGGSIKITAGTLAGIGSIRANGGNGVDSIGGGGAGGCIALFPTANAFAGALTANGGSGANWGGAGSIYLQPTGQNTQLIFDNGGKPGALTPISSSLSTTTLILRNGAIAYQPSSPQTFGNLIIGSNSFLVANSNIGTVNLTITGNATIQPGGGIVTDNLGSIANVGNGAGHAISVSPSYPCTGGGYGGYGALSSGNSAAGGNVYSSLTAPSSLGSGGGGAAPNSFGGSGGGSIRLNVTGTLVASGRISANGGNGFGAGGGGGSGGSIFLTVGTLAGSGAITANGGNGVNSVGGGGGGGRISIAYTANNFVGLLASQGGGGFANGGAGTIYTKANTQSVGQVLVDNGGIMGTNTPLYSALGLPSLPFNLTIQNGAIVCPQPSQPSVLFPQLNNLTILSGGVLTGLTQPATLDVLVFNNLNIAPGGAIAADGVGYAQAAGTGKGLTSGGSGSGAGYGGAGGASIAPGGVTYGSAQQPVDFGSGGGFGSGSPFGGSAGGGAIRLNVGGILTIDGELSAQGQPGWQDNSGGGSGGSIWADVGALSGGGLVAADGGEGELYGGGGGAGGRVALYSRTNAFFGLTTALGAIGDFNGADGTTLISNGVPLLQVTSNSPSGVVSDGVSFAVVYFNEAPNPSSVSASAFSLSTPNGTLPPGSLSVSPVTYSSYRVSFPLQTAVGNYTVNVATNINDLYGRSLSSAYAGTFSVSLPVISGTITDTNGNPIAGVLIQPSTPTSTTTTDTNGYYALGFLPGASFTVTPSLTNFVFMPDSISYTNVSASISNQNYNAVTALVAPILSANTSTTNFGLSWQAVPGLNYQIYSSSNLVDWLPYGSLISGSNGPTQVMLPIGANPAQFYSLRAGN